MHEGETEREAEAVKEAMRTEAWCEETRISLGFGILYFRPLHSTKLLNDQHTPCYQLFRYIIFILTSMLEIYRYSLKCLEMPEILDDTKYELILDDMKYGCLLYLLLCRYEMKFDTLVQPLALRCPRWHLLPKGCSVPCMGYVLSAWAWPRGALHH